MLSLETIKHVSFCVKATIGPAIGLVGRVKDTTESVICLARRTLATLALVYI